MAEAHSSYRPSEKDNSNVMGSPDQPTYKVT
jgi:hypothetical protein